jgi:integrase
VGRCWGGPGSGGRRRDSRVGSSNGSATERASAPSLARATPNAPHTRPAAPKLATATTSPSSAPTLRRTFASDLLNRGLRLEVVSKLLGHASTTVTEHAYAQLVDQTTRRELLRALNHTP